MGISVKYDIFDNYCLFPGDSRNGCYQWLKLKPVVIPEMYFKNKCNYLYKACGHP